MFVVSWVRGYEYHDDYVITDSGEFTYPLADDCYNMGHAERKALDTLLDLDPEWGDTWARITKIESTASAEVEA